MCLYNLMLLPIYLEFAKFSETIVPLWLRTSFEVGLLCNVGVLEVVI